VFSFKVYRNNPLRLKETTMKNLLRKLTIIFTVSPVLLLTACSHKNPLETQPEKDAIVFLTKASSYAEQKMNYKTHRGLVYRICHIRQQPDKTLCPKVYSYIVDYAKQTNSKFSKITIEDLESSEAFDRLRPFYASNNFNSIS